MMKLSFTVMVILSTVLLTRSASQGYFKTVHNTASHTNRAVRQVPAQPLKVCNSSTQGHTDYDLANPKSVWVCKNSEWIPYKLVPTLGSTEKLSAPSCKHLQTQFSSECETSPKNGAYWVNGMLVYCELETTLDGGGWMLVWQHSYMEDLPLTYNMTFFGKHYKPCTQHATGWCNVPNKARFNYTEQMLVAYYNKRVVYAYKGLFNRNIDYDWIGGVLIVHTRIIDRCYNNGGHRPNPVKIIPGITFTKYNSLGYSSSDTYCGNLNNPTDCRWQNCRLPSSISSTRYRTQMTIAIYLR